MTLGSEPSGGTSGFDALKGQLAPDDPARNVKLGDQGDDEDDPLIPWYGPRLGRSRDIDADPTLGEARAGARGEKVKGALSEPIAPGMGYVEMGAEAHGGEAEVFGGVEQPPTPEQERQQADRDKASEQILRSAKDVALDPWRWSPDEVAQIGQQMVDVGLVPEVHTMKDVMGAWGNLIRDTIDYNKARPGTLTTPLDMLDLGYGDPMNRAAVQNKIQARHMLAEPYRWTPGQRADITRRMQDTGLLPDKFTNKDVSDAWGQLVADSAEYNAARPGEAPADPKAMLELEYGNPENLDQVNKKRATKRMLAEPYRWNPGKYSQVTAMMQDAGLLGDEFDSKDVLDAWSQLVEESMAYDEANSDVGAGPSQSGFPGPPGMMPPPGPMPGGPMRPPRFG